MILFALCITFLLHSCGARLVSQKIVSKGDRSLLQTRGHFEVEVVVEGSPEEDLVLVPETGTGPCEGARLLNFTKVGNQTKAVMPKVDHFTTFHVCKLTGDGRELVETIPAQYLNVRTLGPFTLAAFFFVCFCMAFGSPTGSFALLLLAAITTRAMMYADECLSDKQMLCLIASVVGLVHLAVRYPWPSLAVLPVVAAAGVGLAKTAGGEEFLCMDSFQRVPLDFVDFWFWGLVKYVSVPWLTKSALDYLCTGPRLRLLPLGTAALVLGLHRQNLDLYAVAVAALVIALVVSLQRTGKGRRKAAGDSTHPMVTRQRARAASPELSSPAPDRTTPSSPSRFTKLRSLVSPQKPQVGATIKAEAATSSTSAVQPTTVAVPSAPVPTAVPSSGPVKPEDEGYTSSDPTSPQREMRKRKAEGYYTPKKRTATPSKAAKATPKPSPKQPKQPTTPLNRPKRSTSSPAGSSQKRSKK